MAQVASSIQLSLNMVGFAAAIKTLADFSGDLVSTQREFDKINSALITVTGSAEKASEAFTAIQDFAAKTPYDLKQVSESFILMANMGLKTSTDMMTRWGDWAAAVGQSFKTVAMAVDDATRGDNERLKNLGITAKKSGDEVTFTLGGISKTVKANADEVQGALFELTSKFSGGMERMNKTLDGQLSNLSDNFDKFKLSLSQSGFGDAITEQVIKGNAALESMTAYVQSGQFELAIREWAVSVGAVEKDIESSISILTAYLNSEWAGWVYAAGATGTAMGEALGSNFFNNVSTMVRAATVEIASAFDKIEVIKKAAKDRMDARGGFFGVITQENTIEIDQKKKAINEVMDAELNRIEQARVASGTAILAQHEGEKAVTAELRKQSEEKRKQYDDAKKARDAEHKDVLGQYSGTNSKNFGKPSGGHSSGGGVDKAAQEAKREQQEFLRLQEDFYRQKEQLIIQSTKNEIDKINLVEQQELRILKARFDNAKVNAEDRAKLEKDYQEVVTLVHRKAENARQQETEKHQKEFKATVEKYEKQTFDIKNSYHSRSSQVIKRQLQYDIAEVRRQAQEDINIVGRTEQEKLRIKQLAKDRESALNDKASSDLIDNYDKTYSKMTDSILDFSKSVAQSLVEMATDSKKTMGEMVQDIIKKIEEMILEYLLLIAIQSIAYMAGGTATGTGLASSIYRGAGKAAGNTMIGGLLGDAEPHADGGIINTPTIRGKGQSGRNALVGEDGPEAVIPLKNGSVPVQIKSQLSGSSGGNNVNVGNISVVVQSNGKQSGQQQGMEIGQAIKKEIKQMIQMEVQDMHRPGNSLNQTRRI